MITEPNLINTLASAVPGLSAAATNGVWSGPEYADPGVALAGIPIHPLPIASVESGRSGAENEAGSGGESACQVLTPGESSELSSCEEIIETGLKTFIEVGVALTTVRDKRLYRAQYGTFAQYVETRWGMKARQAQRLMVGAEIALNLVMADSNAALGPQLLMPAGERLVRPLAALPAKQQRSAWAVAIETAPDGKLTVKHIEYVVGILLGKAGIEHPTLNDEARKPKTIDARPAGTREVQLHLAADEAISKVRALLEMVGAPDSVVTTGVLHALERLDDFKVHLSKMEVLQEARL